MQKHIAATLKWAREDLPSWLRDGAGVGGLGLIAYGVHQIYGPAGFIVGGAEIVGLVVLSTMGVVRK